MSIKDIIVSSYQALVTWPKRKLVQAVQVLRDQYKEILERNTELSEKIKGLEERISELTEENKRLNEEIEHKKIISINEKANKPSSKQPEWEVKGVGNDGKGKKGKGRGHKPRKGAGNQKKYREPNRTEKATVNQCYLCGKDLAEKEALESSNDRIIEDIPEASFEPEVILIKQEKKYCDECKEVITARSELALPKSDIGINATILIIYLWVAICVPYTKISDYLKTFFGLKITTSGLSTHVIRVSKILKELYEEILQDIKTGVTLYADETGWRVKGRSWWLWVFGTHESAYFTIDKSRGSSVVRRILGEIFWGVLVVDGWYAYLSLICEQQTCMAHFLRKIRRFRAEFPHLIDITKFYIKLRRILRDGERLQKDRENIGEEVFQRRLNRLKERLVDLLRWPNPDDILKKIIKKVARERKRILTFVEHPDVPCHNNFAEYLIRIGVLKRKISGGSTSSEGANAYAILLSIYVTCKLRGISFPEFMKTTLVHYIKTGRPMLFKTYENISCLAKAA